MEFAKDKHIIIPVCLAIAGIIAYRSWHDLHPPEVKSAPAFGSYFLVRDDQTMNSLTRDKENSYPLVIWAGEADIGADMKVVLKPSPVTPVNVQQRELRLLYTLKGPLPAPGDPALDDLGAALHASGEKWRDQGDVINDLYVDPPPGTDAGKLLAFCNPLREGLKKDYFLGVTIDRKSLTALPDADKQLAEATKSTRMLIFDAKQSLQPGETMGEMIVKLSKLEFAYMLRSDEIPDFKALADDVKDHAKGKNVPLLPAFLIDPEKLRQQAQ
jgi:hypothetical protein